MMQVLFLFEVCIGSIDGKLSQTPCLFAVGTDVCSAIPFLLMCLTWRVLSGGLGCVSIPFHAQQCADNPFHAAGAALGMICSSECLCSQGCLFC